MICLQIKGQFFWNCGICLSVELHREGFESSHRSRLVFYLYCPWDIYGSCLMPLILIRKEKETYNWIISLHYSLGPWLDGSCLKITRAAWLSWWHNLLYFIFIFIFCKWHASYTVCNILWKSCPKSSHEIALCTQCKVRAWLIWRAPTSYIVQMTL